MIPKPLILAWLSVLVVAGLGILGWFLHPEHPSRWLFVVFHLPALWGFLELMQAGDLRREKGGIMNWHRSVIAAVGLMVAVKVGFQLAIASELLNADWEPIARRIGGVMFGSLLAIWGNYLPKILSPWCLKDEPFDWQRVHRFAGWIASLSGIALVVVWLALPVEGARLATAGITVTLGVLAVGRKLLSVAASSRRQPPTTPSPATTDTAASD